jgi:hypothetical protein
VLDGGNPALVHGEGAARAKAIELDHCDCPRYLRHAAATLLEDVQA